MSNKDTIRNIINAAREGNAIGVKSGIHEVLRVKIREALGKKKTEISKGLFNGQKK